MTVTKKLLFAAAIVATGYGIAALCGRPNVVDTLVTLPATVSPDRPTSAETSPSAAPSESVYATSLYGAKLVPDNATSSKLQAISPEAPPLHAAQPDVTSPPVAATDTPPTTAIDSIYAVDAPDYRTTEPRAKLRDEAPRPIGFGVRSEAAQRTSPFEPINLGGSAFNDNIGAPPLPMSQSGVSSTAIHAPEAQTSDRGAFSNFPFPGASSSATRLTPLPPPTPTEENEPRTHIVVDGDSLAKLAGRYLDDPRRAEEILEFNRSVLSNPDLLPIGVELVIPPRGAGSILGAGSPHSYAPRAVAVHSAYGSGLVPVSPIPAASTLTPRARLVYPRAAE